VRDRAAGDVAGGRAGQQAAELARDGCAAISGDCGGGGDMGVGGGRSIGLDWIMEEVQGRD
jgi:hypothetical protein